MIAQQLLAAQGGEQASASRHEKEDGAKEDGNATGATSTRRLSATAIAARRHSLSQEDAKKATTQPSQQDDAHRSIKTFTTLQSQPRVGGPDLNWEEYVKDSMLAVPEIRGLVSDALFLAVGQMKPVGLTLDDRVGKYKAREIGFVGMACKHCGGQPGFGRYFPGSFDSFLNGKNCEGVIKHIAAECRVCPARIRDTVLHLEREEGLKPSRKAYGSRKRFVKHIWDTLRTYKLPDEPEESAIAERPGGSNIPWEKITADSEFVTMKDIHLVNDSVTVALAQMKRCQLTEEDRVGRCKGHAIGFNGLCCKHCGGKAGKCGKRSTICVYLLR